jgi:hypothetical protein
MELIVSEGVSTAAGASYWVAFNADIELSAEPGVRLVLGPDVLDGLDGYEASQVEPTAELIRLGMAEAMEGRAVGGDVVLRSIRFHPVDFKADRYRTVAARRMAELLERVEESEGTAWS